jgi:hypothetical protein
LLDEIVQDGLLVRFGTSLAFSHHSFQEYLTARDLEDPTGSKQSKTLKRFVDKGEDWWREVLAFYVAGAENPQNIETWIAQTCGRSAGAVSDRHSRLLYLQNAIKEAHPHFTPRPVEVKSRRILLGPLTSR